MRLIDADAVEDLIMETDPWWCEGMTRAIFEGVKQLPTIDPVKHGKWVSDGAYWKDIYCSVCGEMALSPSYWEVDLCRSDYCPWCGARMEGEKDGE